MLRGATKEDIPQLLALCVLFLKESEYENKKFTYDLAYNSFMMHIYSDNSLVLVDEQGGIVRGFFIGYIDTYPFNGERYAMDLYTYAHPDYRHKGIGYKFWKYYKSWGINRGCDEVLIGNVGNISNIEIYKIYKKLGFEKKGEIHTFKRK